MLSLGSDPGREYCENARPVPSTRKPCCAAVITARRLFTSKQLAGASTVEFEMGAGHIGILVLIPARSTRVGIRSTASTILEVIEGPVGTVGAVW